MKFILSVMILFFYTNAFAVYDYNSAFQQDYFQDTVRSIYELSKNNYLFETGMLSYLPLSDDEANSIQLKILPESNDNPVAEYVKNFQKLVFSTQNRLSISTLWFEVGGIQEEMLKSAILYLNQKADLEKKDIYVRLYFGNPIERVIFNNNVSAKGVIDYFSIKKPSRYFHVGVYKYQSHYQLNRLNHSKIVAVDDDSMLVGGINFVTKEYIKKANVNDEEYGFVNDLSLLINKNGIAHFGHNYLNILTNNINNKEIPGDIACLNNSETDCELGYSRSAFSVEKPFFIPNKFEENYILGVGKSPDCYPLQSFGDSSMFTLLDSAKKEINISQQSIIFKLKGIEYHTQVSINACRAIGRALSRGVKVNIILSGPATLFDDYGDYGNGKQENINCIVKNSDSSVIPFLNNLNFKFAGDRFVKNRAGKSILHAKTVFVDNEYVYVGSENFYYNNHAEYGVIIKSPVFAQKYYDEFWQPLWFHGD